ncbi:MAG: hypothetical protein JSS32_04795 [Verrucomicrobia bacterium]|nr:hypothetical protein [Verrucomicrobiota bacterium]
MNPIPPNSVSITQRTYKGPPVFHFLKAMIGMMEVGIKTGNPVLVDLAYNALRTFSLLWNKKGGRSIPDYFRYSKSSIDSLLSKTNFR